MAPRPLDMFDGRFFGGSIDATCQQGVIPQHTVGILCAIGTLQNTPKRLGGAWLPPDWSVSAAVRAAGAQVTRAAAAGVR